MSDYCCKCVELAAEYGLEEFLASLGEEWESQDGPGSRVLAARFARRVVREMIVAEGGVPLESEVESLSAWLYDGADAVEDPERVARRLREYGIDPAAVREDLPSRRHYHRHLTKCEGRSAAPARITTADGPAMAQDRIRELIHRVEDVAAKAVTDLARADHLDTAAYDVSVRVDAECPRCGRRTSITAVIADGCPRCERMTPGSESDSDGECDSSDAQGGERADAPPS